ncbi:unnamed protein product [Spirodela intermedia]|uniref:F-box domain-containing protein n=1 Tax=Spirodela intermedia TaxID=51605 RepID=A0A7I8IN35_SPIIN|nr:unnamed protein product [Spirodela intermedia]CAA6659387.1 unnamed protein product [Spirodela intermedia]
MESSPSHLSGGGGGGSGPPSGEFSGGAGEHHGALFLVLGYLRLPELLCAQRACRSFRDAVAGDSLLWRDVRVEPPLSGKLTDDGLLEVTSRSGGRLRSLTLVDCWRVTDAALQGSSTRTLTSSRYGAAPSLFLSL